MKQTIIDDRYEKLRQWRNQLAKKKKVRPFRILTNRELREIATECPKDTQELRGIFGIGPIKTEKYGAKLIKLCH